MACATVSAVAAGAAFYYYRVMKPDDRKRLRDKFDAVASGDMSALDMPGMEEMMAAQQQGGPGGMGGEGAGGAQDYMQRMMDQGRPQGGETARYAWTQTEEEVEVKVKVPAYTKSKDVKCVFKTNALKLQVATLDGSEGGALVFDAKTEAAVQPDECVWGFEEADSPDERLLVVSLLKARKTFSNAHWRRVCEGEPENEAPKGPAIMSVPDNDPAALSAAIEGLK